MNQIGYDEFDRNEFFVFVSGEDKLQHKNIEIFNDSVRDHFA